MRLPRRIPGCRRGDSRTDRAGNPECGPVRGWCGAGSGWGIGRCLGRRGGRWCVRRKVIDEWLQQFQTRPHAVAQDHRSAVAAGARCDSYSIAAEGHPFDVFGCGHRSTPLGWVVQTGLESGGPKATWAAGWMAETSPDRSTGIRRGRGALLAAGAAQTWIAKFTRLGGEPSRAVSHRMCRAFNDLRSRVSSWACCWESIPAAGSKPMRCWLAIV
jgi:hypothetical protein